MAGFGDVLNALGSSISQGASYGQQAAGGAQAPQLQPIQQPQYGQQQQGQQNQQDPRMSLIYRILHGYLFGGPQQLQQPSMGFYGQNLNLGAGSPGMGFYGQNLDLGA